MKLFESNIREIISDNKSGSTEILNKTIDSVRGFISQNQRFDNHFIIDKLNYLYDHHSGFTVLFHFINSLFLQIEKEGANSLTNFIDKYKTKWEHAIHSACNLFIDDIDFNGKSILIHSNSSALHNLFSNLAERNIKPLVYQTFSSPAGEGKVQAEYMNNLGFGVRFIHEDAVSKVIDDIDMAVFGADIITGSSFLNKTGTFPLSLLLNYFGKPVYVIADSRKVVDSEKLPEKTATGLFVEKAKPAEELWSNPPANVKPVNYYFEMTPNELVKGFYLENGFVPNDMIKDLL